MITMTIFFFLNLIKLTISSIPIYNCYGLISNDKNFNGLVNFIFKKFYLLKRIILEELII